MPRFSPRAQSAPATSTDPTPVSSPSRAVQGRRLAWVTIGVALGVIATVLWIRWPRDRHDAVPELPLVRLEVELKSDGSLGSEVGTDVVVAPDASRFVFVSRSADGVAFLNTRRLDDGVVHRLPNTEGARVPFFSPDGQWVDSGVAASPKGGCRRFTRACDAADLSGASWGRGRDDRCSPQLRQLFRIPATSGEPTLIVTVARRQDPRWPQILPGETGLVTAVGPQGPTPLISNWSHSWMDAKSCCAGRDLGRYLRADTRI